MDIWDGLRIVLRRWKVALPIFLVFAVLAFVGSGMIDAEYSANGSVMLIGPSTSGAPVADAAAGEGDGNPLVTGCNSCETVARATQLSLSSTEAKQGMAEAGLSTNYTIVVENRSPLMTLTATSDTPQGAVDSLAGVIDLDRVPLCVERNMPVIQGGEELRRRDHHLKVPSAPWHHEHWSSTHESPRVRGWSRGRPANASPSEGHRW